MIDAFGKLNSSQRRTLGVVAGLASASALGVGIAVAAKRRKKKRTVRTNRARKARYNRPKGRYRKTPRTAGKRKDTSSRRIRYTEKGQPYILKANGQSKFITKKSAKSSHKRKGGRY